MLIALIIAIPITNIITGYLVFKGVQVGLRWNMQLKEGKEPELSNPIKQYVEARETKKEEQEAKHEQKKMENAFSSYFGPADIFNPGGDK